jgi:hypothetical protein
MNIFHILFAVLLATIILIKLNSSLKKTEKNKSIGYYLVKNSLEFFVPLTITLIFYSGLMLFVTEGWVFFSYGTLKQLESVITEIARYTKYYLSVELVFGLYLIVFLLGFLRLPYERRNTLYQGIAGVSKWSKRIYVLFVLLCSFTILGTHLGEASKILNVKLKLIRDDYAGLQIKIENVLTQKVADELYTKTLGDLPPSYKSAIDLYQANYLKEKQLLDKYLILHNTYGINLKQANSIRLKHKKQNEILKKLESYIITRKPSLNRPNIINYYDLEKVNYRDIAKVNSYVDNITSKSNNNRIIIFRSIDKKALSIQGAKAFSGIIKSEMFMAWIKAYPIIDPIVDILFNTLDEKLKTQIENNSRKITSRVGQDKIDGRFIDNIISKIINEHKTISNKKLISEITKIANIKKTKLARLVNIEQGINRRIKKAENRIARNLINELGNSSESIRDKAVNRLSQMGEKLSKTHISKIDKIMNHGKAKWSKKLYRESHCTWYQDKSVKYYAASVLLNAKSKYITTTMVSNARKIRIKSITKRRVTDPGWI